jgi:hypothetical protein
LWIQTPIAPALGDAMKALADAIRQIVMIMDTAEIVCEEVHSTHKFCKVDKLPEFVSR